MAIVFSEGCPSASELADDHLDPTKFELSAETYDNGTKREVVASFRVNRGSYSDHSVALGDQPQGSEALESLIRIGQEPSKVLAVGTMLCQRVAFCTGPLEQDGSKHCPAFNEETLLQAANEVL